MACLPHKSPKVGLLHFMTGFLKSYFSLHDHDLQKNECRKFYLRHISWSAACRHDCENHPPQISRIKTDEIKNKLLGHFAKAYARCHYVISNSQDQTINNKVVRWKIRELKFTRKSTIYRMVTWKHKEGLLLSIHGPHTGQELGIKAPRIKSGLIICENTL